MAKISDARYSFASMRPRVFPAEDVGARRNHSRNPCRFNEAAGIPRGRRLAVLADAGGQAASMRPRVFPAEDSLGVGQHRMAQILLQ